MVLAYLVSKLTSLDGFKLFATELLDARGATAILQYQIKIACLIKMC